jgi:hypothetical protein
MEKEKKKEEKSSNKIWIDLDYIKTLTACIPKCIINRMKLCISARQYAYVCRHKYISVHI